MLNWEDRDGFRDYYFLIFTFFHNVSTFYFFFFFLSSLFYYILFLKILYGDFYFLFHDIALSFYFRFSLFCLPESISFLSFSFFFFLAFSFILFLSLTAFLFLYALLMCLNAFSSSFCVTIHLPFFLFVDILFLPCDNYLQISLPSFFYDFSFSSHFLYPFYHLRSFYIYSNGLVLLFLPFIILFFLIIPYRCISSFYKYFFLHNMKCFLQFLFLNISCASFTIHFLFPYVINSFYNLFSFPLP
ncbi:unnamed protein product [Acanthosepion pharaonis]|uniref:Uncharacterized protein n=1 Tax=Acanthosepion pharaonis TaxID=158019 RepID=A0A812AVZ1_ACAPH|nr:unnamed protein product [Sepia pharaonis]